MYIFLHIEIYIYIYILIQCSLVEAHRIAVISRSLGIVSFAVRGSRDAHLGARCIIIVTWIAPVWFQFSMPRRGTSATVRAYLSSWWMSELACIKYWTPASTIARELATAQGSMVQRMEAGVTTRLAVIIAVPPLAVTVVMET